MRHVDREKLILAIDEMHERAWGRGEMGNGGDRRVATDLAAALGWDGEPGTTPDGDWLRKALAAEFR